jgi:hypothetical protein
MLSSGHARRAVGGWTSICSRIADMGSDLPFWHLAVSSGTMRPWSVPVTWGADR